MGRFGYEIPFAESEPDLVELDGYLSVFCYLLPLRFSTMFTTPPIRMSSQPAI
jgi:hypothetical protein